jgi:hypothetical protein
VLRLLGKDPDPAKSREHVLLSVLAERRFQQGQTAELGSLLDEVLNPPVDRIGALDVDDFLPLEAYAALVETPRKGLTSVRGFLTVRHGPAPISLILIPTREAGLNAFRGAVAQLHRVGRTRGGLAAR